MLLVRCVGSVWGQGWRLARTVLLAYLRHLQDDTRITCSSCTRCLCSFPVCVTSTIAHCCRTLGAASMGGCHWVECAVCSALSGSMMQQHASTYGTEACCFKLDMPEVSMRTWLFPGRWWCLLRRHAYRTSARWRLWLACQLALYEHANENACS